MQHINLRAKLLDSTEDFCSKTLLCSSLESQNQALSELIFSIARYQEEGVQLYPKVYLLSDIELALKMLPGSDAIAIGSDRNFNAAVKSAIKKCSPLAINGWCIYVVATDEVSSYGVFRGDTSPVALPIDDTILTDDVPFSTVKIHQITNDNVEVIANNGLVLNISLSHAFQDAHESQGHLNKLVSEITSYCSGVPEDALASSQEDHVKPRFINSLAGIVGFRSGLFGKQVKVPKVVIGTEGDSVEKNEQLISYLSYLISDAIKKSHGCLIAVSKNEEIPRALKHDGICLTKPIDFHELVNVCLRHPNEAGKLTSSGQLVEGMLKSDGIILFSPKAKVLGFNFFVSSTIEDLELRKNKQSDISFTRSLLSKLPKPGASKGSLPNSAIGGARTRAYEKLSSMVGSELRAVFMQSQDGITYFKGTNNE
ncbi:TPA: hypothetical protein N2772_000421 [Vibrio parahaemolyticus]|nr:hypothetical protein [Vibrio parahaemolyticus]HCM0821126.1 hypothetical protein [Vibrio parahaemolyticus]